MSDLIKSKLGYEYDLKDALRHNPTIIMAGDDICAVALRRIEELEDEKARLRDLAGPLFDAAHQVHRDGGRELARLAADFCAALEEKNDE